MTRAATTRSVRIAGILAVAALPRVWAAIGDQGIFWPDEIFQSTEQAHRFAFGYGFVSWEFQYGVRSWLFPGVLGLFWKLLAGLGVRSAPALVVSAKLVMVALALVGIYASMRIAERLGGEEAAVFAGVLGAMFPPSLVYGSRCMTEMASGPIYVLAALLALDHQRWKLVAAGSLGALGVYLRYQNGVIAVALLGWLIAQRRRDAACCYAAGAVVTGLAGGLLDLFTWGAPFHSMLAYARFHFLEVNSATLGVEPFTYYLEVFWSAVGVSIIAVAIGLLECVRRATGLLAVVLLYVLAHSLAPHKEFRYMMPIVPLMLALSGVGLAMFVGRFRPMGWRRTWALAGILAAAMAWKTARASFDDFGQRFGPLSGKQPLWHTVEAVNRLLWAAGEQPDLCGLALVGYGPIWTGGYTYLHRDVPILWGTPVQAESANYVLTRAEVPLPEPYTTILSLGEAKLARRPGPCAAPSDSYTRLFPR